MPCQTQPSGVTSRAGYFLTNLGHTHACVAMAADAKLCRGLHAGALSIVAEKGIVYKTHVRFLYHGTPYPYMPCWSNKRTLPDVLEELRVLS